MRTEPVFVFDTNVLVSAHLIKGTPSDRAYKHALKIGVVAISDALMFEFTDVISRSKFDKYFDIGIAARLGLSDTIQANSILHTPVEKVTVSSDPDDDMILELALVAKAGCIITGDPHLLKLHPFRGIPIVSPAEFLEMF